MIKNKIFPRDQYLLQAGFMEKISRILPSRTHGVQRADKIVNIGNEPVVRTVSEQTRHPSSISLTVNLIPLRMATR